VDYRDFERQLRRIDQLLLLGGVEKSFVEQSLAVTNLIGVIKFAELAS
jgi:hypothetical protein